MKKANKNRFADHYCPDCGKPTTGCNIRLYFSEPEVIENARCRKCAKKAGLIVLPPEPWQDGYRCTKV